MKSLEKLSDFQLSRTEQQATQGGIDGEHVEFANFGTHSYETSTTGFNGEPDAVDKKAYDICWPA